MKSTTLFRVFALLCIWMTAGAKAGEEERSRQRKQRTDRPVYTGYTGYTGYKLGYRPGSRLVSKPGYTGCTGYTGYIGNMTIEGRRAPKRAKRSKPGTKPEAKPGSAGSTAKPGSTAKQPAAAAAAAATGSGYTGSAADTGYRYIDRCMTKLEGKRAPKLGKQRTKLEVEAKLEAKQISKQISRQRARDRRAKRDTYDTYEFDEEALVQILDETSRAQPGPGNSCIRAGIVSLTVLLAAAVALIFWILQKKTKTCDKESSFSKKLK